MMPWNTLTKVGKELSKTVAVMAFSFLIGMSAMAGAICAASFFNVVVAMGYEKGAK